LTKKFIIQIIIIYLIYLPYISYLFKLQNIFLEFASTFQHRFIGLPRLRLENETFPDTCLFTLTRFDAQNSLSLHVCDVSLQCCSYYVGLFVSLLTAESCEGNFMVNAKANIHTANFNLPRIYNKK